MSDSHVFTRAKYHHQLCGEYHKRNTDKVLTIVYHVSKHILGSTPSRLQIRMAMKDLFDSNAYFHQVVDALTPTKLLWLDDEDLPNFAEAFDEFMRLRQAQGLTGAVNHRVVLRHIAWLLGKDIDPPESSVYWIGVQEQMIAWKSKKDAERRIALQEGILRYTSMCVNCTGEIVAFCL